LETVIGNLFLGTLLGELAWDPYLGNCFLGTFVDNLFLGTFGNLWEPVPGNLELCESGFWLLRPAPKPLLWLDRRLTLLGKIRKQRNLHFALSLIFKSCDLPGALFSQFFNFFKSAWPLAFLFTLFPVSKIVICQPHAFTCFTCYFFCVFIFNLHVWLGFAFFTHYDVC
jgi:hypothetical protein